MHKFRKYSRIKPLRHFVLDCNKIVMVGGQGTRTSKATHQIKWTFAYDFLVLVAIVHQSFTGEITEEKRYKGRVATAFIHDFFLQLGIQMAPVAIGKEIRG